jgi:PHD/YefM family antitoxin component YafN of YafNO toxin-antitoxin module
MSTQFVIDEKGEKVAALIPIEEYHELMEDLEDLAAIVERRNEETISAEEFKRELEKNGVLSD